MKLPILIITLFSLSAFTPPPINAYKILGVFPTMAKSHWIIGSSLLKGLAEAGHEVTAISPFTIKPPVKNLKIIQIQGIEEIIKKLTPDVLAIEKMGVIEMFNQFTTMCLTITNHTLTHPLMVDFLASDTKFDVIVLEMFLTEAMLGLGHHFNAPVVIVSTFGSSRMTNDLVGTPSPLSYVPHPFLSFTDRMTFWERVANTIMTGFERVQSIYFYDQYQEEIYNNVFAEPKPTLDELKRNVSLVLLNTHVTLSTPKPYSPNMIEVGGLQVNSVPKPLPEDLKNFIESAKDGVVYFSLGSNVRSVDLPEEKRAALLNTFRKLKQKVLWKWEDPNLPNKPDNVLISTWFPQDDILSHPNIRLFITHGGLLSTTEATYHGVPLIGIPIFGDQKLNMARTENAGYGLTVAYQNLTEESISWALNEMLSNTKYSTQAKIVSSRYRDQPMAPLKTAIYWVEYVARHRGAPHLHSAGQDLLFIQYHNLDVFTFFIAIIFTVIYLFIASVKWCCCKKTKGGSSESKAKKGTTKKKNN